MGRLVAAGVLPQERCSGAEYLAWSLVIDGPLQRFTQTQRADEIGERLLDMVEKGL